VEAGLTIELIEKGSICGQGATAAAKQGHVYVPDGSANASDLTEVFRAETLRIYKEMTAAHFDLGFRQTGAARPFVADSWFEKLMTKLEWWTYQRATSKLYDSVSLDGPQLEAEQNLYETSGGMWDADAAVVMPCKVLEAFRKHIKALGGNIRVNTDVLSIETETYPFTTERKYNVELSRETLTTFASPIEGMPKISVTQPGGWVQARSVVVAVGYWHNDFMKKHFVSADCPSPDFVGVASQTAIYTLPTPLPPTPASIFSYSVGAVLQEVAPARFQAAYAWSCRDFAPTYFLTSCKGSTWARYLYATVWGRGDQTTRGSGDQGYANQSHWHNELLHPWGSESLQFSTGTRREPVENTTHCICPPGSDECLPFAAPGVPYELHHETWAFERAARLYGIKKEAAKRVENYTACFPTGMDGQVYARQLRGCRGRYPRLYVLNGLAGEGITRGPGAGLHLAQLIGKALNKTAGPRDIPQRNLVWVLEDLSYEFTVGTLIFLFALSGLSTFLFCVHWRGPRQGRLRNKQGRREAGEKFGFFMCYTTCAVPMIAISAIASEALPLLGGYFLSWFIIVGCALLWKRYLRSPVKAWCRKHRPFKRGKTGSSQELVAIAPNPKE